MLSHYNSIASICALISDFFVAHESPAVVSVSNFRSAVTLYCVSSVHVETTYCWKILGDASCKRVFPSTPVIYVNSGGLYQCTLTRKAIQVCGKVITVRVDIGNSKNSTHVLCINL